MEGSSRPVTAQANDRFCYIDRRPENIRRRYPHQLDPLPSQKLIALEVSLRPITHVVRHAIDFDAKLHRSAVEIDDERTDRVLSAKLEALRGPAQFAPQQALGQR